MQTQSKQDRGLVMIFTPAAIALIAVLIIGYFAAIILGTWAYFANDKES